MPYNVLNAVWTGARGQLTTTAKPYSCPCSTSPLTSSHSMHASKQYNPSFLTAHLLIYTKSQCSSCRPQSDSPQCDGMSKTRVKVPQLSQPNSGNQNTGDLRLISKFGLFHGDMNPTNLLVRKRLVDGLIFPFLLPLFHGDRKGSARDRMVSAGRDVWGGSCE